MPPAPHVAARRGRGRQIRRRTPPQPPDPNPAELRLPLGEGGGRQAERTVGRGDVRVSGSQERSE